jgi:hypothetical protein
MAETANGPSRGRQRATAGLVVLFLVVSVVNTSLLVINEPPPDSVSQTQYQSLLFSVSAAIYFAENGVQLVHGLGSEPPVRFEDVAADDVGYPIGLASATSLGVVTFSETTRAFLGQTWDLEESRVFMYETLRAEMHYLNRVLFAVTATLSSTGLLAVAWFHTVRRRTWSNVVGLATAILVVGHAAPHLLPRLFVFRLHVHGVIASLALLGFVSVLAIRYSLLSLGFQASTRLRIARATMTIVAGAAFATAILIRRAEGLVWLVIASAVGIVYLISAWKSRVSTKSLVGRTAVVAFAFLAGFVVPAIAVDRAIETRETEVSNLAGETQPALHPIYHATLIGISRSPRNSLGIASEPDVVELVRSQTGIRGDAFSAEYEAASRRVFWDYVIMSPLNYAAVLIDNVDETFDFALSYAGVRVAPYGRVLLAGAIALGLVVLTRMMLRRGGVFRFLAVTLWGYLLLEFLAAIATTSPATIGLATAALLLGTCGLAAWLAGRIERLAGARVG